MIYLDYQFLLYMIYFPIKFGNTFFNDLRKKSHGKTLQRPIYFMETIAFI